MPFATLFLLFCSVSPAAIELEIPIHLKNTSKLQQLLPSPGFLATALENSGSRISFGGKIRIAGIGKATLERKAAIPFKSAHISYRNKIGTKYYYEVALDWNWLGVQTKLKTQLILNTDQLSQGKLKAILETPYSGIVPTPLLKRAKEFIARVANPEAVEKLDRYFKEPLHYPSLEEQILVDAYNRSSAFNGGFIPQPGDSESLSEQIFLVLTLLIWGLGVPMTLLIKKFRMRRLRTNEQV